MANKAEKKDGKKIEALRVTSKRDGFRRGGRAWTGTTYVAGDGVTDALVERLKAEPLLVVDVCEVDEDQVVKL